MFDWFFKLILDVLQYIHQYTGNYGWDIIILTAFVRVLLLPLTFSGLKGMKAMQAAQPLIKELQEKYKDDREKQSKEMMALYKELGVNPFSSCLPMLLQLPVFIALYRVLSLPEINGYILVNTDFYGMNLTSAAFTKLSPEFLADIALIMPGMIDLSTFGISFFQNAYLYTPVLVVVALMTVTTIIQQQMMTIDPQQKTTMWFMNIFIVYISFIMPAGVLLYWGVSNVLQFAQQAVTKGPAGDKLGINTAKKAAVPGKNVKSAGAAAAVSGAKSGKESNSGKKQDKQTDNKVSGGKKNTAGGKKKNKKRKKRKR